MTPDRSGRPQAEPGLEPGILYLMPASLEQTATPRPWLLEADRQRLAGLRLFYVETPKAARAWLRALPVARPIQTLALRPLPGHGDAATTDWTDWLAPVLGGESAAILPDAGCPGVADPGAGLVAAAHRAGIRVRPLVGPGAILLALMASGLDGQQFAFHGYLPVPTVEREARLAALAAQSARTGATQILIETPFRNAAMLASLLRALPADARLCIAVDLTGAGESVRTMPVAQWRREPATLPRNPAVFLFGCPRTQAGPAPSDQRRRSSAGSRS